MNRYPSITHRDSVNLLIHAGRVGKWFKVDTPVPRVRHAVLRLLALGYVEACEFGRVRITPRGRRQLRK